MEMIFNCYNVKMQYFSLKLLVYLLFVSFRLFANAKLIATQVCFKSEFSKFSNIKQGNNLPYSS